MKYKLFVVEDDSAIRNIVVHKLGNIPDMSVNAYSSIEKSFEDISERPDFYVIDHILEHSNGIDCIPVLREFTPHAVIIILSAQEDVFVFEKAFTLGADYYFIKDSSGIEAMVKTVSELIQEQEYPGTHAILHWYENRNHEEGLFQKKQLIYLVEDNANTAHAMEFILQKNPLNNIRSFQSSETFLSAFEKEKPDIAILDYDLQEELTGMDLLKKIKKESPNTKVIMVSGQKNIVIACDLIRLGASYYLVKSNDSILRVDALTKQMNPGIQ